MESAVREIYRRGTVIPAMPLALDAQRRLDERRQRALARYYSDAGAGGIAVAVHTTQFAIRDPAVGLLEPVLALAAEEMDRLDADRPEPLVRVAGVCGPTPQAVREAEAARGHGYHTALLSLAALADADEEALLEHVRAVAGVLPVTGFYLQPSVGGRALAYGFWRRLFDEPGVIAAKIAPFHRYRTLDVLRAAAASGRSDLALYTGNDDHIILDLLTPYRFVVDGETVEVRMNGGLLGHWSVWTRRAVEQHEACRRAVAAGAGAPPDLLRLSGEVTDANAALFDVAHGFAGCIAGLHEVLRRQGLFEGLWCLDPDEGLSPGQAEEIDRVCAAYPHLPDDDFVAAGRDAWLSG